jgi:hypothetical protein
MIGQKKLCTMLLILYYEQHTFMTAMNNITKQTRTTYDNNIIFAIPLCTPPFI